MVDGFRWALVQNLAYRVCSECEHFSTLKTDFQNLRITIKGKLTLGSEEFETGTSAQCTFIADDQWIESPPVIICKEPWITLGKVDWHISKEGILCWDYNTYWKDCMAEVIDEVTEGEAAEFGKVWMLRSVRNLLNRHLFAYRSGIKEWRKEWDYWEHGTRAAQEYLKLSRAQRYSTAGAPRV